MGICVSFSSHCWDFIGFEPVLSKGLENRMTRIERGEGMAKVNGSALRKKKGNRLGMSLLALELWG